MMARGLERRDTSSERNRTNGIFKGRGRRRIPGAIAPDRLNGKGLPPHHPDACGLRTRIPGRTVLRATMARSPKAVSFKRTAGKAVPLTAGGRRMRRAGRRIPARHRSRRAPQRMPGAKRTSTRRRRPKRSAPGKSWERLGRNWTRPRQNGQRRSRRGLQKRQSGEPAQKRGSMSTTRYTRSSMKMWVWKEPINPSWPQRPEPGN